MYDLAKEKTSAGYVRVSVVSKQQSVFYDLREGESALVGQSAGCQLRIVHAAPHQCLLEMRDGNLLLHNWSEDGSTTVNGYSVTDEIVLKLSDVVAFGENSIRFEWLDHTSDSTPNSPNHDDLMIDIAAAPTDPIFESVEVANPREVETVQSSTIALLHSEISFLQKELEERDAMIAQFEVVGECGPPQEESKVKVSQDRFDELLLELQQSDERLACVTHELRITEELREAELEEKEQVTAWVNQIEQLVAKREAEISAEIKVLTQRCEREKAERLMHQRRADDGVGGEGDAFEQLQGTLKVLRRDHEMLREKYDQATERILQLEKECRENRDANTEGSIKARVDESLRLERLKISQERAAISRREYEIASKLRELEVQLENHGRLHESDMRIKVFRDRLKELHEEEMSEYQAPSVGQRLLNLWRSLDGPTDRD